MTAALTVPIFMCSQAPLWMSHRNAISKGDSITAKMNTLKQFSFTLIGYFHFFQWFEILKAFFYLAKIPERIPRVGYEHTIICAICGVHVILFFKMEVHWGLFPAFIGWAAVIFAGLAGPCGGASENNANFCDFQVGCPRHVFFAISSVQVFCSISMTGWASHIFFSAHSLEWTVFPHTVPSISI